MASRTANLCTNILDRGFGSSRILVLRVGILMSIGNFPETLSQQILAGITLAARLGVVSVARLPSYLCLFICMSCLVVFSYSYSVVFLCYVYHFWLFLVYLFLAWHLAVSVAWPARAAPGLGSGPTKIIPTEIIQSPS